MEILKKVSNYVTLLTVYPITALLKWEIYLKNMDYSPSFQGRLLQMGMSTSTIRGVTKHEGTLTKDGWVFSSDVNYHEGVSKRLSLWAISWR